MNLRNATFSATRWTTAAAVTRAVLQLLQTAILARLLAPADFGLMAMAGVALGIALLLSDFGLSSALMHFPSPGLPTLSTLYWINLGLGTLLGLLFAATAWPLTHIYGQAELLPLLALLALTFPLSALGQPFRILAEKTLQFRPLAQNEIIAAVLGFLVALALAATNSGVYALAAGTLITTGVGSLLAWWRLSEGVRPNWYFSPALAKSYLAFGLHRVGDGFWNAMLMQSDIFLAGLIASPSFVAHYTVPRDLCLKIANAVINPVITRVGLPVMTQLQHDQVALRSVYLKTLRMAASLNFPTYALLALFAEDVVALLLGPQWLGAALYMRIFALWGLIRSTGNPVGSLIYAVGIAKRAHIWNLTLFLFTAPLLWIAAKFGGLLGLAWTLLIWQACIFWLAWRHLVRPACGASFFAYCASLAAPFIVTAITAGATLICIQSISPVSWRLPSGAVFFGTLYLALSRHYNLEWWNAMRQLLAPLSELRQRLR
ncbi:MAG: MOP flippase family protein [Ottowia sp.]|uniref:MOP flippase family protein n=1 Tax=Ottowia sp. TaxID=1898956 RepID=UPI003C71BD8A